MSGKRTLREDAREIWSAGVVAVDAGALVRRQLTVRGTMLRAADVEVDLTGARAVAVVGAGKAGAAMSEATARALRGLPGGVSLSGWVNVPDGEVKRLPHIVLHGARASHANTPSAAGAEGARRVLELARGLGPRDVLLVLLSGGGSALLPAPAGVSLEDKVRVTELLLASGATIAEMNTVRKHLSLIKGGGLARATRARVVTLIVSDVVGDPLDAIASGPTAPDPTTYRDALDVLERFVLSARAPDAVLRHLRRGAAGEFPETLKKPVARVRHVVLGSNRSAVEAAARKARALGYGVMHLSSCIEGESREVGVVLAGIARGLRDEGRAEKRLCVLSGGETTVRLSGAHGRGGRNQELVLAAVEHLWADGLRDVAFLSGGTDGEDGPTDAAGAVADTALVRRAARRGLRPLDYLLRHDAYSFFEAAGGLLKTGRTRTNVMDLRVVLVGSGRGRRAR